MAIARSVLLPVLDLMGGVVVRGVAGQRRAYRPVQSQWFATADPAEVAQQLRTLFPSENGDDLYIADLDAIESNEPHLQDIARVSAEGRVWLDAGLRQVSQHHELESQLMALNASVGNLDWVVGLESLNSLQELAELLGAIGPARTILSLDLMAGHPKTNVESLRRTEPLAIAEQAVSFGLQRMIILDLGSVGVAGGPSTTELCHEFRRRHPAVELTSGGGVRDIGDIQTLVDVGCDRVLVASAIHHGAITPAQFRA